MQWKRGDPQRRKYYQALSKLKKFGEKIEEILPQKMGEQIKEIPQKTGEQTVHICLNADVPEDSSDTSVGEQEVTQPSDLLQVDLQNKVYPGWINREIQN